MPQYARLLQTFLQGQPYCVLITEFYGESEKEVAAKVQGLRAHLQRQNIGEAIVSILDPALQANVWAVRKAGLGLMMSIKGDHKPLPFIEDAAVPVEHLAEYVTRIEKFCSDLGTRVAYYAHASGGCIHIRPLINAKKAEEVARLPQISEFAVELLGQYGGALSSEHGDGRARSWLNERFFGKELYRLFKEVKRTFDPHGILNPGIIVDPQKMTENLRYGPEYRVISLREHLDFHEDMGFHRAVEMCNGAGVCRKKTTGTMCPSFMVTREEMHSTRGRANALRAAMSGLLPASEFASHKMFEVMDLCIECKACKAECPSSVDMAKIKFEFLAHYYEENGISLRSKILGDLHRWQKWAGGKWAPVANALARNPFSRQILHKILGIAPQRRLPEFARPNFLTWAQRRQASETAREGNNRVILFADCFNSYYQPEVAIAAVEFLEGLGFRVEVYGQGCCGRTMISKGLVQKARSAARQTVETLETAGEGHLPIIGLEPSCLLSLRDEYAYLLPGDARVQSLAKRSFLFEEFIAEFGGNTPQTPSLTQTPWQILVHGHCHQKALVGTGPTRQALEWLPDCRVEEIDSGCCGMAGSFGYEKEHYEISLAMAERRLMPAVRHASEDTLIVAPGFSCRSQILHCTGRKALHPAQVLRQAIEPAKLG
ncbi:MAG: FAD-binding oxidoreductase [Calditrichaeota bacterium]|nr:MAG: FAD-binding oxidoreductase [Calditrichota bacterium]